MQYTHIICKDIVAVIVFIFTLKYKNYRYRVQQIIRLWLPCKNLKWCIRLLVCCS